MEHVTSESVADSGCVWYEIELYFTEPPEIVQSIWAKISFDGFKPNPKISPHFSQATEPSCFVK